MENKTFYGVDDGLPLNEKGVGVWSEDKYALVRLYAHLFTCGMKDKWRSLTYVDLYAGHGLSRIPGTSTVLLGSPLIALSVEVPFTKYVFWEKDHEAITALQTRVDRDFSAKNVAFVEGDCNQKCAEIASEIPSNSLTLIFVDPYDLSINFKTIQELSKNRNVDFLCLLASRTDAGRNEAVYVAEESTKVDLFLGDKQWRQNWDLEKKRTQNFGDFLCSEFANRMEKLGYLPNPPHEMRTIKDSNRALYRLALFARHGTAKHFWQQVLKYSIPQRTLF